MSRNSETPTSPAVLLILGGTTDGYVLAERLSANNSYCVISSLAGRTLHPRLPAGEVRVGGFGGVAGLAGYLEQRQVVAVIDATHPFASTMGWNAARACQMGLPSPRLGGVPLLRLERPPWRPVPGDQWQEVDDWEQAAEALRGRASRVLLAIGRQELAPFAVLSDVWFLIRSVDPPDPLPPFAQAEVLLARGPFRKVDERSLLHQRQIDTIVCKNSGGTATDGKLEAARELGLRVVMRQRPPRPVIPTVTTIDDAVAWVATVTERARLRGE